MALFGLNGIYLFIIGDPDTLKTLFIREGVAKLRDGFHLKISAGWSLTVYHRSTHSENRTDYFSNFLALVYLPPSKFPTFPLASSSVQRSLFPHA